MKSTVLKTFIRIGIALAALILLSMVLAVISNGFLSIHGWNSFFGVSFLSAAIVLGVWQLMRSEKPPAWVLYLVVAAALLRLAVGVIWTVALPVWGHGTPAEINGYVMGDAAGRDQAAWRLARSDESLQRAFQDNRKVDQYGGLLFVSAILYRYLGGSTHQPLLMVVLGAACSALAVLFAWAFARRVWDDKAASISAWLVFLYPEAVLLGSSQMREAFTIPFAAASFYGLARYRDDRSLASLLWILVPSLLTFFLSSLSAVLLLGCLLIAALGMLKFGSKNLYQHRWFWLALLLLVIVGFVGVFMALREVVPARITNPVAMLDWWLRKSASFQAYTSQHASGWMQKIFKFTPEWSHLPMLTAYGVVQPFFPAALVAGTEGPIWRLIAIWRAAGWTLLLGFLAFAPFHALRRNGERSLVRVFTLIVWLVILVAAYRGGSDMWDNPRYRAIFIVLQVVLVARIIVEENRTRDPWLRRALLFAGSILAWFFPWYVQRYYSVGWMVTDPFRILVLGICTGILLVLADWAHTSFPARRTASSVEPTVPQSTSE